MRAYVRKVPFPIWVLVILTVLVGAWSWTWPDSPLTPDEGMGKAMVDAVATQGDPWGREPILGYEDGFFGVEYYGAYRNNTIVYPSVGVAVAYEQGLLGVKAGRMLTLIVGVAAVAYMGGRINGPWAAAFGGMLYLSSPATLFFHGSYFANSGGAAYFLASIALLDACRRHWWLVLFSVLAIGVSAMFRPEYAVGYALALGVCAFPGPVRNWRALLTLAASLAGAWWALWKIPDWMPGISTRLLASEGIDLREALLHPIQTTMARFSTYGEGTNTFGTPEFIENANEYFVWFFPLVGLLALAGLLLRPRGPTGTWVYIPLAGMSGVMAYFVMDGMRDLDFANLFWLESSAVRYFLEMYAFLALLAGVALGAIPWSRLDKVSVPHLPPLPHLVPTFLAVLLVSSSLVQAVEAEHGIEWANARRAWYDEIEAASKTLGDAPVLVGITPSKFVFETPVLGPHRPYDVRRSVDIATDLIAKNHSVYGVEPWFWNDQGFNVAGSMLTGGHTYWTNTSVMVPCVPCDEFVLFYELHRTNASLQNVEQMGRGHFEDAPEGLRSVENRSFFWPERSVHISLGLGDTDNGVAVTLEVLNDHNGTHTAGYLSLIHI